MQQEVADAGFDVLPAVVPPRLFGRPLGLSVRALAEVAEDADPHSLGRQLLDHGPEALGLLLHPGRQLRGPGADPFVELGGSPECRRDHAPAAGGGEVIANEPPIGAGAAGRRLLVRAFVVEVAEDEHQVADPAGDQLVLDALVLEEVERRVDEGQGAQPRHGDLQVGVGTFELSR